MNKKMEHRKKMRFDSSYSLRLIEQLESENANIFYEKIQLENQTNIELANLYYQNMILEGRVNQENADLWYEVMIGGNS